MNLSPRIMATNMERTTWVLFWLGSTRRNEIIDHHNNQSHHIISTITFLFKKIITHHYSNESSIDFLTYKYAELSEYRFLLGWQITPLFNTVSVSPLLKRLASDYTTYLYPYLHSRVVYILMEYSQGEVYNSFVIWNHGFPQAK